MVKNANRFAAIVVAPCYSPVAAVAFSEIPDWQRVEKW